MLLNIIKLRGFATSAYGSALESFQYGMNSDSGEKLEGLEVTSVSNPQNDDVVIEPGIVLKEVKRSACKYFKDRTDRTDMMRIKNIHKLLIKLDIFTITLGWGSKFVTISVVLPVMKSVIQLLKPAYI